MTKLEEAIAMAACEMSRDARAELLNRLKDGLDGTEQNVIDEAWTVEIERRLQAMDRGEGASVNSDEFIARLRAKRPI